MPRHPNKHIRDAIAYAIGHGWRLKEASGMAHEWGRLFCPHGERGGCMNTYEFTVVLANVEEFSNDALDRLFGSGCDDGTPGRFAGECVIEFDRSAPSLEAAIRSAIDNVWSAGFDVKRVQLDVGARSK